MKIQARNCPGAAFLTGVKSDTYAIEIKRFSAMIR